MQDLFLIDQLEVPEVVAAATLPVWIPARSERDSSMPLSVTTTHVSAATAQASRAKPAARHACVPCSNVLDDASYPTALGSTDLADQLQN